MEEPACGWNGHLRPYCAGAIQAAHPFSTMLLLSVFACPIALLRYLPCNHNQPGLPLHIGTGRFSQGIIFLRLRGSDFFGLSRRIRAGEHLCLGIGDHSGRCGRCLL
jgi:hypothetical protein